MVALLDQFVYQGGRRGEADRHRRWGGGGHLGRGGVRDLAGLRIFQLQLELLDLPATLISNTPADRRSRAKRWRDVVTALLAAQAEYTAWSDALPNSLRDTATGQALQEIVDLDLDDLAAIQPPRGYGLD